MPAKSVPLVTRVLTKCRVDPDTGCWLFAGKRDRNGYGILQGVTKPHTVRAHIVVYEATRGAIPPGYVLHHHCQNPSCTNPFHVAPMTNAEHTRLHADMRTHCSRGHEYNEENTRYTKEHDHGWRIRTCRVCDREDHHARWYANVEESRAQRRRRHAANKEEINAKRRAQRRDTHTNRAD